MLERARRTAPLLLTLAALSLTASCGGADPGSEPDAIRHGHGGLVIDAPPVLLRGVGGELLVDASRVFERPLTVQITWRDPDSGALVELARDTLRSGEDNLGLEVSPPESERGRIRLMVTAEDERGVLAANSVETRSISSAWAFLPPLVAIGLALAFRQVIPALVLGVLAGAWIRTGFSFAAPLRLLDHDLVRALLDPDHLKIVLFTLMLGGMVGVIGKSGGAGALVKAASRWARSRRTGQAAGWFAGMFVFFDDYANTLIVGPSLRPLTDRLRISREKLAFVVDATAAPIASVAIISTWVGYEVGLIADAIEGTSLAGRDAYSVFLASLPYRFYAWLMLGFVLLVALTGRDFGPMLSAERRAASGSVLRPDSRPLSQTDLLDGTSPAHPSQAPWLAVAPVLTLTLVTGFSLWITGWSALAATGSEWALKSPLAVLFSLRGLGAVLGEASSFDSLLYGAASGVLVALVAAVVQRRLRFGASVDAFTEGVRSMTLAIMILTLAWMIGGVCTDLDTAGAALHWVGDALPVRFLPALTFLLAAAISFATGTSWSTMAVLIPIAVPLADRLALAAEWAAADIGTLLVAVTGAVLTGAVFGDHCSPISDTTVLSSVASGCDHIDHVRTQLPYALAVGAVSVIVGDLAVGFGLPLWSALAIGAAVLVLLLYVVGRRSEIPKEDAEILYGD